VPPLPTFKKVQYCRRLTMTNSATTVVSAEGPFLDRVLDATFTIWHDGLTRGAYARWWTAQLGTPWGSARLKRSALVSGSEVLASAKEYHLDAVLDGHPVAVLGLGAVFTQPEHRSRGYARDLIERLVDRAAEEGAGAALLFSEIGAGYYRPLGFEPIVTSESIVRVTEAARHGAPATLVRAGEERDLPAIAAMGRVRANPFRFHLDRGPELVHYATAKKRLLAGLGPPGLRETQFFVAEEGASAVAYVLISVRGSDWVLEEAGDRDPSAARVGAILQALVARHPAERRPAIRARLPAGFQPPQLSIVESHPTAEVMMIRPLGKTRIMPPLSERDVLYWQSDVF
jgi:GNAT superfamily N-acetyltransferase